MHDLVAEERHEGAAGGVSRNVRSGPLKGVRRFESPEELPDGVRSILLSILYVEGASELGSVRHFQPWLTLAPTVEDQCAIARVVADEARHGLEFCRLLREFTPEGPRISARLARTPSVEVGLEAFDRPIGCWPEVAAFLCFVDRVGLLHRRNFADCCYGPLARAMPSMINDERSHVGLGAALLRRMLRGDGGGSQPDEAVEAAVKWCRIALRMFGDASGGTDGRANEVGLTAARGSDLRDQFLEEVAAVGRSIGLAALPDLVGVAP